MEKREDFMSELHNVEDKERLAKLGEHVRSHMATAQPEGDAPYLFPIEDDRGRTIIFDWKQTQQYLTQGKPMYFVGFFGTKQANVTTEAKRVIEEDDALLISNHLLKVPGLLAYASTAMPSNDWCNLVLVSDLSVIDTIFNQPFHKTVALDHSRHYYDSIRLHNGRLQGQLNSPDSYKLLSTRYIKYPAPGQQPSYNTRRYKPA